VVCQQNKGETIKTLGLLQPLVISIQSWEEVSMHLSIGLPKSEGKTIIMVLMDQLINYAHFCSLSLSLSLSLKESAVATKFIDETFENLHRVPKIIVSDEDPIFTGNFWIEFFFC
jgi:hypothetical protein